MPGYHAIVAGEQDADYNTTVYSTIAKNLFEKYSWHRPIQAFDLPMDTMSRHRGYESMTENELLARLRASGRTYWIGRVYRNYESTRGGANELDLHIHFKGDDNTYHYVLHMPDVVVEAEATTMGHPNIHDDDPYPAPCQWYLATTKTYVGIKPDANFGTIAPVSEDGAIAAEAPDAEGAPMDD